MKARICHPGIQKPVVRRLVNYLFFKTVLIQVHISLYQTPLAGPSYLAATETLRYLVRLSTRPNSVDVVPSTPVPGIGLVLFCYPPDEETMLQQYKIQLYYFVVTMGNNSFCTK